MAALDYFQCTLLGTVEVTRSMRLLDSHQRLRMAKLCHRAIVKKKIEDEDRSWLQASVFFSRPVKLKMDSTTRVITLYNGNDLMCQHPVGTISAMVTLDGSDGHLVYIGHCSKANGRLAVVLSFSTLKDANSMVKEFENIKGQDSAGVDVIPNNLAGGPPPIPTAPKPSASSLPPLPPKPRNTTIAEGSDSEYENEGGKEENPYEEEKREDSNEDDDDNYVNDSSKKQSKPYENPETPQRAEPALPPRRSMQTKSDSQSPESLKENPKLSSQEVKVKKGFFDKILGKKDKLYESRQAQNRRGPLPSAPSNTNPIPSTSPSSSNTPRPIIPIPSQSSDSDEDAYVNDTFYEKIGLDPKAQERVYMKSSPKNTRSITNGIDYLLDNENKYNTTVTNLSEGKKLFPVEIQPYLGAIEKLPELHKDLFKALSASKESTIEIAKAFILRKDKFEVYQSIIINSLKVEKKLKDASANEKAKIREMHDPLRQVRKRLHFYFMHLEGLFSSASEHEKIKIQEAVDMLKNYYRNGDTGILIKSIRKSPIQIMMYKPLHLHSMIHVSGPHISDKEYRVLLFEEIIVIALPVDVDHEYQLDIRLEVATVTDPNKPNTLTLRVDHGGVRQLENYNFRFNEEKVMQEWKNEILAIHQRYMVKIKANAL